MLASAERQLLSEPTLVDLDALLAHLLNVQAQGHAVSVGENAFGLRTVVTPILGADGRALAAISAKAGRGDTLDAFVARTLPRLQRISAALSRAVLFTASAA